MKSWQLAARRLYAVFIRVPSRCILRLIRPAQGGRSLWKAPPHLLHRSVVDAHLVIVVSVHTDFVFRSLAKIGGHRAGRRFNGFQIDIPLERIGPAGGINNV